MTIKEGRNILHCKLMAEVMNVMSRPYFLPAKGVANYKQFLKSSYKTASSMELDLSKKKLTLKLVIDYGKD